MKKISTLTAAVALIAVSGSAFAAGASTFQQTCSNITFVYAGSAPALQATCLKADGSPNATSLVITGISNQNGKLTAGSGASSFQQSCGNIQIAVTTGAANLTAFCRTSSGASNSTSIVLNGISNNNGNLTY